MMKFRQPAVFSSRERPFLNSVTCTFSTSFFFCCLSPQGVSLYCSSVGTLFSPGFPPARFGIFVSPRFLMALFLVNQTLAWKLTILSDHFCLVEVLVPIEEGPAWDVSQFSTCLDFWTTRKLFRILSWLVLLYISEVIHNPFKHAFNFFYSNQFGIFLHCFSDKLHSYCGVGPDCFTEYLLDVFFLIIR